VFKGECGELAEVLPSLEACIPQVILNLMLNAADAMIDVHDRPRDLHISSSADPGGVVCILVRDAGIGFEPDKVEQFFQPFHTTKADGMGVGLSISRSIIEAHGGRLWGTPNPDGQGATFAFSVPSDLSAADHLTIPTSGYARVLVKR